MTSSLLVVRVGPYTFGAPTEAVTEILGQPPLTPLPRTPAVVAGMAVVRGQPLAVLTVRPLIGLERVDAVLVLRWQGPGGVVLVAVDQVETLIVPGVELPSEAWAGLVPVDVMPLIVASYRHGNDWLWAWPPNLPDLLLRSVASTASVPSDLRAARAEVPS